MIIEYRMNYVRAQEAFRHMNTYRYMNNLDKVEGQVNSSKDFEDWIGEYIAAVTPLDDWNICHDTNRPREGINWFGLEIPIKAYPYIALGTIRFVLN